MKSMATRAVKKLQASSVVSDRYFDLVRQFPLRVIRSEEELDRASEMINSLGGDRDPAVHEYRLALAALIERYEDEHHDIPDASPAERLQFLMESRGVNQAQVIAETGLASSTLSEILSGKRGMSRAVIQKLAAYFYVEPGLFV